MIFGYTFFPNFLLILGYQSKLIIEMILYNKKFNQNRVVKYNLNNKIIIPLLTESTRFRISIHIIKILFAFNNCLKGKGNKAHLSLKGNNYF